LNETVLLYIFAGRSVARNVTVDSERSASRTVSLPVTVANGTASSANQSHHAVAHSRPRERPRSIGSQLEPLKAVDVKRTSSIRLEDISSPRLQSSTNQTVTEVPASRADEADMIGTKLQPTRAAPAPPAEQSHKPPQRPPPPCPPAEQSYKPPQRPPPPYPASRDISAVTAAGSHYEEIALRSPTGPPPAPPDSRHRFYSAQVPRQPASVADQTDDVPAISVSSMHSKFEPVRSSSPSVGQLNCVAQQQTRRDINNCSTVPAKCQTAAATRPQHATVARPSAGVSESQC